MEGLMLIVDDVEINREILRVLFKERYEIMTAESGEEALAVLESCQGNIDIVLLDLQLPGRTGLELLAQRKELSYFKEVPVVVITSSNLLDDQVKAFDLGANDYIQKPFVPEIVRSRVNNVMAATRRLVSVELEAAQLRVKSEVDDMTGLFNKTTMEVLCTERLKHNVGQIDALLVIDVDNFKTVNDTSGHQAGDRILKIVANLISSRFRKSDYVGRVGGDEFCVLMVNVPSLEIVRQKVNELIQIMRYKPNLTIPEYVTLSIGLTDNKGKPTSYVELFEHADEALYRAKKAGRAQYQEYGLDQIDLRNDVRPVALLISSNRSVCSAVHALLPQQIRVVEALKLDDITRVSAEDRARVCLVYADVSDMTENTDGYWKRLKEIAWFGADKIYAICREGRVTQYLEALQSGVRDMLTAPLEMEAFRRRMRQRLEELGLLE